MRIAIFISVLILGFGAQSNAQLGESYTQYLFNQYALNPAVAGSKTCWDFKIAHRRQWLQLPNAPVTYFASAHKAIGREENYDLNWHGIGAMFSRDEVGPFTQMSFLPSYAFHLRVRRFMMLSFGAYAGVRQSVYQGSSLQNITVNDPILTSDQTAYLLPDAGAGLWLYSQDFYMGLSARQIYPFKLKTIGEIGSPAPNDMNYYFTMGKRYESSSYYYSFIPSIHIKYALATMPSVDLNWMMYVRDNFGWGIGYRVLDAVNLMVQFRMFDKLKLGYSAGYSHHSLRFQNFGNHEIVLSYNPCGSGAKDRKICPAYD